MESLVSIIIPVYNSDQYLRRCVESAINQSYANLDIILINDGSSDESGMICDEFLARDSRIRVVHKENGGPSSARNIGIDLARGRYITFLDSDDWIHNEFIEKTMRILNALEADIVVCDFLEVGSENFIANKIDPVVMQFTSREALERLSDDLYIQLVIPCAKIFSRYLFDELRFKEGRFHEDDFIAHHLLFQAKLICYTTEVLYYYRQHGSSIMGSGFSIKKSNDALDAVKARAQFYETLGMTEAKKRTNRKLFSIYRVFFENVDGSTRKEKWPEFQQFLSELRSSRFGPVFRIGFELYAMSPRIVNFLYKQVKGTGS